MHFMKKAKKGGFTLIELLVVVAIIGILAAVVLSSVGATRAKARDTARTQAVHQLQVALELYRNSTGSYPDSSACGATIPSNAWCNSVESLTGTHWIRDKGVQAVLAPYIPIEPKDPLQGATTNWTPLNGGTIYYYSTGAKAGGGKAYEIVYGLENTASPIQNQNGVRMCDGSIDNWGTGNNGIITVGANCL